jgi:hypothetical protein
MNKYISIHLGVSNPIASLSDLLFLIVNNNC